VINSGKILLILLIWGGISPNISAQDSNLGPFRFKNMFLKGAFGTKEDLIDNLKQSPNISSWDTLGAQNMTHGMVLLGYKYRSSQTQLSYLSNILLSDYRLISHALKLQESVQFGRYALFSMGGIFSLSTANTIPDTNTFIDSRIYKGDASVSLYLTKIVNTKTEYEYNIQDELNGDENVTKDFAHTVNYTVNPKLTLFIRIRNFDSKLNAFETDKSREFSLLTGMGGIKLTKYFRVISGSFAMGMTINQKGAIYTQRNANANIEGSFNFKFQKINQSVKIYNKLIPTFNSDKQWSFNKSFLTDNSSNLLYNDNPIVQIWGTKLKTTYAFSTNFNVSLGILWERRIFPVGRRKDIHFGLNPELKFKITRFNSLVLFYEVKRNWSTVPEAHLAEGEQDNLPVTDPGEPVITFASGEQNFDYLMNKAGFKLEVNFSTQREK